MSKLLGIYFILTERSCLWWSEHPAGCARRALSTAPALSSAQTQSFPLSYLQIFRCRMPFIPQTLSGCFLKKQILRWRFVCCRKSIRKYSKEKKNKNSQRIREAGLAEGGVTAEAATQELCSEWLLGIFQQVEGLCVLPWIVIRGWPLLGTECKLVWDDCLWQKAMPREGLSFELSAAETQCLEMSAWILNGSSGRHTTLPATAPLQRGFHCVQRPCLIYLSLHHSAELVLGPTRSE